MLWDQLPLGCAADFVVWACSDGKLTCIALCDLPNFFVDSTTFEHMNGFQMVLNSSDSIDPFRKSSLIYILNWTGWQNPTQVQSYLPKLNQNRNFFHFSRIPVAFKC